MDVGSIVHSAGTTAAITDTDKDEIMRNFERMRESVTEAAAIQPVQQLGLVIERISVSVLYFRPSPIQRWPVAPVTVPVAGRWRDYVSPGL